VLFARHVVVERFGEGLEVWKSGFGSPAPMISFLRKLKLYLFCLDFV
jgi:hypothetical protein